MDKKEIYEHLANIYLNASSKRKKKSQSFPKLFKTLFFASIALTFLFAFFFFKTLNKNKSLNSEIALELQHEVVKINFNFDPVKKETFSINLKQLDLTRFKALGFSIKKSDYKDNISLRVEFASVFREKSEVYLKDIAHKWRDYKISFSEFKNISDWSRMLSLSFVVEEWNAKEKKDVIYIDNLRLLK